MQDRRVIPLRRPSEPERADPSSGDLLARAQRGDELATAALFRRFLPYVRGLVFRLVPQDPDADDIVQQSLVTALDSLGSARDAERFKGWLRAIVVNVVRAHLRRRGLLRRLGFGAAREVDLDAVVTDEAPTDVRAELRAVYGMLAQLSPDCRIVLVLSRVEGLSLVEIAEELSMSLSTVKRRVGTAEQEFSRELARQRGTG